MLRSLARIGIIGRMTLTEAIRQKVLSVLLIFGLFLVGASSFFSQLLIEEQIKFVKDFGCGAIGLIGFAIAVISTAQLIPLELQNRTIYTILAKPVRRAEFLFGKFLGVALLVIVSVAIMTLALAATLAYQERVGVATIDRQYAAQLPQWAQNQTLRESRDKDVGALVQQARDPQLLKVLLLLLAKLLMTAALALFISTFATSSMFTIVTTFFLYLIGHLEGTAREVWLAPGGQTSLWQTTLLGLISTLVPDLNAFTIVDEVLAGNAVPWAHTASLLGYAGVYVLVILLLSEIVFRFREL